MRRRRRTHLVVGLPRIMAEPSKVPGSKVTRLDLALFIDTAKSCLPKRPSDFAPDVIGFGSVTVMSACSHARISGLLK